MKTRSELKTVDFLLIVVFFTAWYLVIAEYLDRPTVEISVKTNTCVRAYGPDGPMSCAEALKVRHEAIYVDYQRHDIP